MTSPPSEAAQEAAGRIERWLLTSPIQIAAGPQRGGIAGWLEADGQPQYVYLEITGYYLTAMAWLVAREEPGEAAARARGALAVAWLARAVGVGAIPPTRLYLGEGPEDWRNDAIFSFDLAMAARGLAAFVEAAGPQPAAGAPSAALLACLDAISDGAPALRSHLSRGEVMLPERWSTVPGPHHLKAAGAVRGLPCTPALAATAAYTRKLWSERMLEGDPVPELHPLLYALEGIAMDAAGTLEAVGPPFRRLMELQRPDGALPAETAASRLVRSDVLAQLLRIGVLLEAAGMLAEPEWRERLGLLASRLLDHVGADGSVRFSAESAVSNAWCAMFAQQALVLYASPDSRTVALARRYLV